MGIRVILSEEEILSTPNHQELGKKVYDKFWEIKNKVKPDFLNQFGDTEGNIKQKLNDEIENDYVHLTVGVGGELESINRVEEYERCAICGKQSPYLMSTPIDSRIGYIEGVGQGCFHLMGCKNVE